MPRYFKAIFFDVDDTLFDRRRAQGLIVARMVAEFPHLFAGLGPEDVDRAFLESDRISEEEYTLDLPADRFRARRMKLFLSLLGLGDGQSGDLAEMYVTVYPTLDAPVAGASQVLERLVGRCRLGVISNGLPDVQHKKLGALGIRGHFECVVLSTELGVAKPSPGIFIHAASLLDAAPGDSIYVGDSYADDVLGAKGAGLAACWFNPTGVAVDRGVRPDFEARSLAEVPDLLLPGPT
jgi:FMN phosphatase YigB (HAD superfamily)